ncbi:MAG: HEAT repeat domain-containing protein [Planctomycetaceae bacterium]|nr:HEAT repeat domain-containing protein [Planctomycetaceae bacterium]
MDFVDEKQTVRPNLAGDTARRSLVAALVALLSVCCPPTQGATPSSPEVKTSIARAVNFLETTTPDERLGAKVLAARVLLYQNRADHRLVNEAVEAIRLQLRMMTNADVSIIYSLGLSLVFLTELDSTQYRADIDQVVRALLSRQKPHGGWGYPHAEAGDTSMTQYAIYGLWSAEQYRIRVEERVWNDGMRWLMRVQDVGGGWPYQGQFPQDHKKIAQADVRRSMTEAALASLHLCGSHYGTFDFHRANGEGTTVSPLLKPVDGSARSAPLQTTNTDRTALQTAIADGLRWLAAEMPPLNQEFPFYHLYTIERFQTFRAVSLGTGADVNAPAEWYDEGVEYLLRNQHGDGGWDGGEGRVAATAFGALFLIRSTRTSIQKIEALGAGTLFGGRGVKVFEGRPTPVRTGPTTSTEAQFDALVKQLENPAFIDTLTGLENLQPIPDTPAPDTLMKRLISLANGDSPEAKAAALRALGRCHDVSQAPLLIGAIGDPNPMVHQAAVDGLRFLTRDALNYGKPVAADEASRAAEAKRWTEWYRKVTPGRE